jgi:ABC-type amino acid transport substrate-binding protein
MKTRIWTRGAVRFFTSPWIVVLLGVGVIGCQPAWAGAIDKIREDQTLRIAYREDAPPFSYKEANNTEPTGYMVQLCQAVAKKLANQLGIPGLKVSYVSVTAANRFEAIEKHDADLLCEATSATLSRRRKVDFSIATFADGASLLTNDPNLQDLKGLAGKKVGVLAGTTTEEALRNTLKAQNIQAEVVPAKTHDEGLTMLDGNQVSAYFGDLSILMFLLERSKAPDKLRLGEDYLTVEPYALALAHGDEDFRLAVDTALSHIYRSGEIASIFKQSFAGKVQPSDLVKALYRLSGLPD